MNVLSFDVESNGLHGEAFAVAAVLVETPDHIKSQFVARCPVTGPLDPWVKENVLGPMTGIDQTHDTARAMRDAFWVWYIDAKASADIIVASNPYPVEAQFLLACQGDDMAARGFDHPFPYFDLTSMLFARGINTPAKRRDFVAACAAGVNGAAHNPVWDATATALAALKLLSMPAESRG